MGEENHEDLQSGATYTFERTDQGEPHYEGDSLKGEGGELYRYPVEECFR